MLSPTYGSSFVSAGGGEPSGLSSSSSSSSSSGSSFSVPTPDVVFSSSAFVSAPGSFIDSPERLTEFYRNDGLLGALHPLDDASVLQYFAGSPFYSRDSINERVRLGVVGASAARQHVGVEYVVRPRGGAAGAPDTLGLFVIERRERLSPTHVKTLSVYYCLHGTIYQCADVGSLLAARIERAAYHIMQATRALERARQESGASFSAAGAPSAPAPPAGAYMRPAIAADYTAQDLRPAMAVQALSQALAGAAAAAAAAAAAPE